MKPLCVLLSACLLLAAPGAVAAAAGDAVYGRPGRLVSAGHGWRLNLYCMGRGAPAVVFESGFEDWSPAWATVHRQVAAFTRACAYDRAGAGFSEAGPMPRSSLRIADELHAALRNAGVAGPYVLVGHAFGGDHVRAFALRHPRDVAGLVLEDADATDLEPPELQAVDHRGNESVIARLRECRDAIAAGKPLPMLPARPGRPPRTCAQQFFRGLPEDAWSPELNAKLLEIARTKVAMYDADISEMEEVNGDEAYLTAHRLWLGARPVRVITTRNHGVGRLDPARAESPEHARYEDQVAQAQAQWLKLSSNARQVFTRSSSEYVQFDEPETLVATLRETVEESRKAAPRRQR